MNGDGPLPVELNILSVINRFGSDAVYGRPLWTHEIKNLISAEVIRDAYNAREESGDYADWCKKYPARARTLNDAMRENNVSN